MSYLTTQDYGLIGNHFSAALVSRLGSIDWCCFPYLDSPSHFANYSDRNQGGKFQIAPQGEFRTRQQYYSRTQVLETLFETPTGRGILSDWMPLGENSTSGPMICRKLAVIEGTICWGLLCHPRFQYGSEPAQAEKNPRGVLFRGSQFEDRVILQADFPINIQLQSAAVTGEVTLDAGQSTTVLWLWGRRGDLSEVNVHQKLIVPEIQPTLLKWKQIAHQCPPEGCLFGGPWQKSSHGPD